MDAAIRRLSRDGEVSGTTGAVIIADNSDAYAARVVAARVAERSLDLMYYLWHDDRTGLLLLSEVLAAADRGVQVRLLLDDINPRHGGHPFVALNSHPNIQLRLFNPTRIRSAGLLRTLELVVRRFALTRRMHNKAWIVDGRLAIVGGRNVGDAYFNAADTNFRDLDMMLVGKAVAETSAVFEAFWNFRSAKPLENINTAAFARPLPPSQTDTASLDRNLSEALERRPTIDTFLSGDDFCWTDSARVISDPPQKAKGRRKSNWLTNELRPLISGATRSLEIVSPYFIPGRDGMAILTGLVAKGTTVEVLTNSLAATDVAVVHGGYANYRKALLRNGITLYELQPYDGASRMTMFGSRGASLHTKAFTVDDTHGFVGSLNFDPRSLSLNTEMGVLFEDDALVAQLQGIFRREIAPESSYRVTLNGRRLRWAGVRDGTPRTFDHEPEASLRRRLLAALVRVLPIEAEL